MGGEQMRTYPHPLDYVAGLKYAAVDRSLGIEYTSSPETFVVEELVDLESLGFNREKGGYLVLRVVKSRVETLKAVEDVARRLNVPPSNVHILGLKDKNATTISHFFVKASLVDPRLFPLEAKGLYVEALGFVKKKPTMSALHGNRFKVILDVDRDGLFESLKELVREIYLRGLPSYYGYQRFGVRRYNTHLLGKLFLIGREDLFAHLLLGELFPRENVEVGVKRLTRNFRGLAYEQYYIKFRVDYASNTLAKKTRGILVDAYASYLYNLLLNRVVESRGYESLDAEFPMPGCLNAVDMYSEIFKSEGVPLSIAHRLPCFERHGLFRPKNNRVYYERGRLIYEFELEPGLYATVVLRELFKEKLMFKD
jgi:tRNA pseudouridine13 synthase